MVDASADHVGAALQQRRSAAADWQPLAFFSKKLEPAQMRYSAFDRELFACVAGIRHFRYMLEGRPFTVTPTTSLVVTAVAASLVNLDNARIATNQKTCQETLKAVNSTSLQSPYMEIQGEKVVLPR